MITACVLVSFIIVNVSANIDMNDYKQQVFLTNKLIQKVYDHNTAIGNGLENLIKTNVCDTTMGLLNLMFATPDHFQYSGQMPISYLLQRDLLQTIHHTFLFPVPEPHKYPGNLNLAELGDKRREYTGKALENIIRSGFKYQTIYRAGTQEKEFKLIHICRLTALYINIKRLSMNNSSAYIDTVEDDIFGICTLTCTHDGSTNYYKKFEKQIFQVRPDGTPIQPLLDSASTASSSVVISIEDQTDN